VLSNFRDFVIIIFLISKLVMQTIRQAIINLLSQYEMDARELSQELGIREKEVYDHLVHVGRSVKAEKKRLIIHPSRCLQCGFVFEDRKRFTRPGRCPKCRQSRLLSPRYRIG
jgi:predicted Zn-ribbon and HTH transcriptional regulator